MKTIIFSIKVIIIIFLLPQNAISQTFPIPDYVKSYVVNYLFKDTSHTNEKIYSNYFLKNIINRVYSGEKISIYAFASYSTPIHSFILIISENKKTKTCKVLGEFDNLSSDIGYLFILMTKYKFTDKEKVLLYDYLASSAYLKKELEN